MNTAIVFSQDVLRMIQSLPDSDRQSVVMAIANDMLLGTNKAGRELSASAYIIYGMITCSIRRDTVRYNRSLA